MECSYDQVENTLIFRIDERKLDTSLSFQVKEKLAELLENKEIKNLLTKNK